MRLTVCARIQELANKYKAVECKSALSKLSTPWAHYCLPTRKKSNVYFLKFIINLFSYSFNNLLVVGYIYLNIKILLLGKVISNKVLKSPYKNDPSYLYTLCAYNK